MRGGKILLDSTGLAPTPSRTVHGRWTLGRSAHGPELAPLQQPTPRALSASRCGDGGDRYDYVFWPQFVHKRKAVYEVFGKLRARSNSERTVMQQRWKRRE